MASPWGGVLMPCDTLILSIRRVRVKQVVREKWRRDGKAESPGGPVSPRPGARIRERKGRARRGTARHTRPGLGLELGIVDDPSARHDRVPRAVVVEVVVPRVDKGLGPYGVGVVARVGVRPVVARDRVAVGRVIPAPAVAVG